MAVLIELTDRDSLVKSASTLLNSKVVSEPILDSARCRRCALNGGPVKPKVADLRDIKIVKNIRRQY